VVSLGGGSTTGLGKAIAVRTGADQVVIPTTYAGSEMTDILGETSGGEKVTRRDPAIRPEVVIYDVDLTLTLPVANGEQDYGFYGFRWLIANDGIDIVQPHNYYFGGLIRSMKVARMAAGYGKEFVPHMSGGGLGFLYNIHMVSAVKNAGEHHEFKSFKTNVRYECKTSPLKVADGKIQVPTGPGFGVEFDPDWVKKHRAVTL